MSKLNFMPELFRCYARAGFEGFDEIGDIIESTSISDLRYAQVFFLGHQLGGMTDAELVHEIDKCFLCSLFKEAAKRLRSKVAIARNFFQ